MSTSCSSPPSHTDVWRHRPTVSMPSSVPETLPPSPKARSPRLRQALPTWITRRALRYIVGYALWACLAVLWRLHALVRTPDGVDALRASGGYNAVPGWLGPGAWLAYCATTYTTLARALYAIRAASRIRSAAPALPGAEHDADDGADEAWDPDLTTSALFTVFAWVALLSGSRTRADVDANVLVLSAEGVAVVAGFCVGHLGSVLWASVLWRLPRPTGRLCAPDSQLARTALRRLVTCAVLATGSAGVLFIFNRRMAARALPQSDPRVRGPFVLSLHGDFGGLFGLCSFAVLGMHCMSAYALFFVLNIHDNPLWRGTPRCVGSASGTR
jgi:hypothetical protein